MRAPKYRNREEAGEVLASRLQPHEGGETTVLAIPNGGVAVGVPMARALRCALHLLVVRKIQIPWNTEAGFGAIAADGTTVLDDKLLTQLNLKPCEIEGQKEKARQSIQLRLSRFGRWATFPELRGKTVILVDDGLASGSTMEAGVKIVRSHCPQRIVVAVPTSSRRAYLRLKPLADDIICPDLSRLPIFAVADAYEHWYDLTDEEVLRLLESLG